MTGREATIFNDEDIERGLAADANPAGDAAMTRRRFSIGLLSMVVVLVAAARRGIAAPDPSTFIANLGAEGMQALAPQVPPAQRLALFRGLFQANFDVVGLGQFVLGRHWWGLTPTQQQEYLRLFQEFTVMVYSNRLGEYGGGPFRVIGGRRSGSETIISSQVVRSGGRPVRIDWYVDDRGGRLVITDVAVDGVSMRITQRNYFQSIIQSNGGRSDAILAVLRQEIAQSR